MSYFPRNMAFIFSGLWMVSIFLKDFKVWGQSQGVYLFLLKQFSLVWLLSPPSWRFYRNTQLVFKDSDVYMVENLFNWNFYIKIFFKKKCACQNRRDYTLGINFSPMSSCYWNVGFPAYSFSDMNSTITWRDPYILFRSFVFSYPIAVWARVYLGGMDEERESGC